MPRQRPPGRGPSLRQAICGLLLAVNVVAAAQQQQSQQPHQQQNLPRHSNGSPREVPLADTVFAQHQNKQQHPYSQVSREQPSLGSTRRSSKRTALAPPHNNERALATLAPADAHPAVAAPSARSTGPTAGLTRRPARSLQDWEVEDFVLLATVDGTLYSRDRSSGQARWALQFERPMVETTYHRRNKSDDEGGIDMADNALWIVEPSQDGALYVYSSEQGVGIQKLGITVKQLVEELSPFGGDDDNSPIVYTGEKRNTLYTVDAASGTILKSFHSGGAAIFDDRSCKRVSGLEEFVAQECEPLGLLTLGRTEYTVAISDKRTGESIATIRYFEWSPNVRDRDLHNQYSQTLDKRYVYSRFDGTIRALNHAEGAASDRFAWQQKLTSPVVRVFDIVRPYTENGEEVSNSDTSLVILPQPSQPIKSDEEMLQTVFVNCTESGSWYALSEQSYPSVTDGARQAECYKLALTETQIDQLDPRKILVGVHPLNGPIVPEDPGGNRISSPGSRPALGGGHVEEEYDYFVPLVDLPRSTFGTIIATIFSLRAVEVLVLMGTIVFLCQQWFPRLDTVIPGLHRILPQTSPPIEVAALAEPIKVDDVVVEPPIEKKVERESEPGVQPEVPMEPELKVEAEAVPEPVLEKASEAVPEPTTGNALEKELEPAVEEIAPVRERVVRFAEPEEIPDDTTNASDALTRETSVETEGDMENSTESVKLDVASTDPLTSTEGDRSPTKEDEPSPEQPKPKKKAHRGQRGGRNKKKGKRNEPTKEEQEDVNRLMEEVKALEATNALGTSTSTSGVVEIGSITVITEKVLGSGSGGTFVFEGTFQGRQVAVKRMLPQYYELAEQEVNLLQQSDDHANVIRYFAQEKDENFLYIAVELCQASLFDLFREDKTELCDIHTSLINDILRDPAKALKQLAGGLYHLHRLRIIHRDIKPQNILIAYPKKNSISEGPVLKISDFGLCKTLPEDVSTLMATTGNNAGTVGWKAPELISQPKEIAGQNSSTGQSRDDSSPGDGSSNGGVKRAIDIFSLGCVFYYVLSQGGHPFDDEEGWMQLRELNIKKNKHRIDKLRFGADSEEPVDLVSRMLDMKPERRPTAMQVMRHPFFWKKEDRLAFLCDVSDHYEHEPRDPPSHDLHVLEHQAPFVLADSFLKGGFLAKLDKKFTDTLGKQRKYTGDSLLDLLRALRNKKNHYEDMTPDVKALVGGLPDGYLDYWTIRFPKLLMSCYTVVLECGLEGLPRFKKYFDPE